MTVDAPDWDSKLMGHSAVVLDSEDAPVCHAVITAYPNGEPIDETECEKSLNRETTKPREEFDGSEYEMCTRCWPPSIASE